MGEPGFWDDQARAARISSEHARLNRRLETYERVTGEAAELRELAEIATEEGELTEVEEAVGSAEGRAGATPGGRALHR